jgi:hypothetical protein
MRKIICHARKIKEAVGLVAVSQHNSRRKVKKPEEIVHPENATYNRNWQIHGQGIMKSWTSITENFQKLGMRKPQKNAAYGIEFIYSASPEFWDAMRNKYPGKMFFKKAHEYFQDCWAFHKERYGSNTLQCSIHCDETNPHFHIIDIPIIQTKEGMVKYTSGHYLGDREGLQQLQQQVWEKVGKKWGLERGTEGSTARHTDQVEWIASVKKQEQELKVQKEKLDARATAVEKKDQVLKKAYTIGEDWDWPKKRPGESYEVYQARVKQEIRIIKTAQQLPAHRYRPDVDHRGR